MQGSSVHGTGGRWAWPLFGFALLSHLNVPSVFGDIYCPAGGKEEEICCVYSLVCPQDPPTSERLDGLSRVTSRIKPQAEDSKVRKPLMSKALLALAPKLMFPKQLLCGICPSREHERKGASHPATHPASVHSEHRSTDGEDCGGAVAGKGPWSRPLGEGGVSNQSKSLESSEATGLSARMSRSSRGKGNILDKKVCMYKIQKHHRWLVVVGGVQKVVILPGREEAEASC